MKRTLVFSLLLAISSILLAQKPYRGAEVYSNDDVLYGKFVMHMKMIKGSGMLSTFFTYMGDSWKEGVFWEEIDIEVLGKDNAQIMSTNIITDGVVGDEKHSTEEVHVDYSLADDYHTYTLIWTPDSIVWYIDDELSRKETGDVIKVLTSPEGYRFNAWISCSPGWVGEIDRGALPQYQYVDWIEYHSFEADTFKFEWRDDFDSFDNARWSKADWTFDCNQVDFVPQNAYTEDGKLVLALSDPNPPSTAIREVNSNGFVVFQSAENQNINLEFAKKEARSIELFSISGVLLKTIASDGLRASVSGNGLNEGIYLVRVRSAHAVETQQILLK